MKCNTCGSENVEGARFCAACGANVAAVLPVENTLVGQVVGARYHVRRVLGEGGMGVVYEAEQNMGSATRKVALKTLHAHLSRDPSVSQRFNRECGTIAQLEHPNTIKVYDFGATADGTLYIAMEFVAGQPLSKLIEESKRLRPGHVLRIIRQIAGSLDEAHAQGVIHRDLKPDNVVITQRAGEKDVVKLLDFGIAARTESADARHEQKLTQQGMVLGTPPYMSPEQFSGKPLDGRSDLYSLGVMTYEMLTGRLPFNADTPWQWATEHMTAQPIPFEATPEATEVPPSMRATVLRALSKAKEDRQSSAQQFADELAGDGTMTGTGPVLAVPAQTAAMSAPPSLGAPAVGPAMPNGMTPPIFPAGGSPILPTSASPVSGMAATPESPAPASGRGKALIVGLAVTAGILTVGAVVALTRPKTGSPPTIASSEAASLSAGIAPPVQAPPAAPDQGPPEKQAVVNPPAHAEEPHHGSVEREKAPAMATGCAACLSAARAGNYPGAAFAFRSCNEPEKKTECASLVQGSAVGAAKTAAFNGSCRQAREIAAAGRAMGVSERAFARVLETCK